MVNLEEPDKGRAWLVAFAACIINMIISGLSRIISIVYVAVIDDYSVTRAEANLPFTVRSSVRCLSGPLVGILGERFGVQTVTFYGGIMATVGAALSSIAPNIVWLTVFWGGMHGLGFSLTTTLFQALVNQHFQKYRATASGLTLSGACLGSLVLPILVEWILDTYGLSGLFLLLAGIVMHVLPPSIMLCPPQWVKYPQAYARLWILKNPNRTLFEMAHKVADKTKDGQLMNTGMTETSLRNRPMMNMGNNHVVPPENHISGPEVCSSSEQMPNEVVGKIRKTEATPPTTTSLSNITVFQSVKKIGKLYLNPMYVLISISMAAYLFIFNPILTVLVDYGKDKGFAEFYGKYLINAMAIGDLIGRICFGWVTDKKLMTTSNFMCLMLVLGGTFVVLLPFASTITFFIVLLVLYSITAGSILVLFPILVHQYVDSNAQSVAMACVRFFSGIISFGVPSMIGHFRDEVGSYDGMFYLTGLVSIVCGGMWIIEHILVKYQQGSEDESTVKPHDEDTFKTTANDP